MNRTKESIFRPGDPIIFRVDKVSTHPGPRARDVEPSPRGDHYTYQVDKYWTVKKNLDDGRLLAITRRGKFHLIDPDSPRLRHPSWLEWLFHRSRFPSI